jgi:response regulator RpfG family c-di-GMP phosphodiesterase
MEISYTNCGIVALPALTPPYTAPSCSDRPTEWSGYHQQQGMASILIVDDHPALRLALRTQLSQLLGVTTLLEADNGQGALNLVRQHRPDLVLLDLDIPA